ncbi:16S rRNA (uracil(1498)-N(3))-methyltransferase [Flagellimonas zhangzhouensis]|uniref:Ribosomal RNA small subunit methyltransferase E n=1 Tax=Flagellimonas zhangzhouensis TaxID=1073328 RepID=A0A1H2YQJ5_9FLAO|nr:16S rRNA (uracil(1498)-N(3))-methyltransferase [Allomuricauda zhangzhouensis]SDR00964.1 16S rRNA (uracil1498-N3)-methyltransferase [Allomuricauda zhangzhouensis]SDX06914.1 16S rRNA (uracil1498-N3)-methyltransferase [Allomuricauda zhangzhouensis]
MQLFYNPNIDFSAKQFVFPPDESKHIVRVLRKTEGDVLHITNGKGYLFEAEIMVPDQKRCKARIISETKAIPKRFKLHMVVAPTKMNDRYEWFLEKATEIGVDEITPIICDHSERKVIKLDRLERVLQSAMKQSLQTVLPQINPPITATEFLNSDVEGQKFIAHCMEGEKMELKRKVIPDQDLTIMIGPEGDFSKNEVDLAKEKGYVPVSLGNTRLRTETAAIVACATVAMINN